MNLSTIFYRYWPIKDSIMLLLWPQDIQNICHAMLYRMSEEEKKKYLSYSYMNFGIQINAVITGGIDIPQSKTIIDDKKFIGCIMSYVFKSLEYKTVESPFIYTLYVYSENSRSKTIFILNTRKNTNGRVHTLLDSTYIHKLSNAKQTSAVVINHTNDDQMLLQAVTSFCSSLLTNKDLWKIVANNNIIS